MIFLFSGFVGLVWPGNSHTDKVGDTAAASAARIERQRDVQYNKTPYTIIIIIGY